MQEQTRQLSLVLAVLLLLGGVAWLMLSGWGEAGPATEEPAPDRPPEATQQSEDPIRTSDLERTLLATAGESGVQVTGRVVDRYDEPLSPATVSVDTAPPAATTANGQFTLRTTASGAITLLVQARDHAPFLSEHSLEGVSGSLDVGDLQLLSGGGISGRITDQAGNPVPGATATLRPSGGMRRSMEQVGLLLVPIPISATGSYRFEHVMPGYYRITASAPGMQVARSASTFEVKEGVGTKVDTIRLEVGFALSGVVLDPDNKPVAGAEVRIRNRRPRFRGQVTTQEDGRFQIGQLPPGPLQVEVTAPRFLSFRRSDVDPTRKEELVVRLRKGIRVTGIVRDSQSGAPVERFAAAIRPIGELDAGNLGSMTRQLRRKIESLRQPPRGAETAEARARRQAILAAFEARLRRVEQQRRSQPAARPTGVGPVKARPGGRFAFEGLDEGVYAVDIAPPQHQFVRVQPVEVRVDAPPPNLRVEVTKGHVLSGTVVSRPEGAPIAGAQVALKRVVEVSQQRLDQRRSLYPFAFARSGPQGVTILAGVTDKGGRFELHQAPPGRYFLAIRHPQTADYESEPFYVHADNLKVQAKVGLRAELSGRVHGIPPRRGGQVEVLVFGGHGTMRTVKVALDGSYRIAALQPGKYIVRAYPADSRRYVSRELAKVFAPNAVTADPKKEIRHDVMLASGEQRTLDLTLDLPPAGIVIGSVTINGKPGKRGLAVLRPVPGAAPGSGGLPLWASLDDSGAFTIRDAPAGKYTLRFYSRSPRQELHSQQITVTPSATATVQVNVVAGGLAGRVLTPDGAPAQEVRGNLMVYPGATEAPTDLRKYRQTHRVHRVRVRNGVFRGEGLTPGPALLVVEIRSRRPVTTKVNIPSGTTLPLELMAGSN